MSMNINYATYARQGFFQLMFVSFINLIIILMTKSKEQKITKQDNKYIKTMNLLMIFLTLIIIISSFVRMKMYEQAYGYTVLRLLVYVALITEIILLIPTIIYILKDKYNIVKPYLFITITIYVIINFLNFDYIIANRNVNRYFAREHTMSYDNDLDLYYLENYHTDNIKVLIDLYDKTEDELLKKDLKDYLSLNLQNNINGFQEFNLSKYYSHKLLKEFTK